jgi:hypothetical protein
MEKMNFGPSPENEKSTPPPVELKKRKKFNPDDYDVSNVEIDRNTLPSGEPEIAALEQYFAEFETKFPLVELHAITTLSKENGYKHPLRDEAKASLGPITEMIHVLEEETNTSAEKIIEYTNRYKLLSRAVGIISGGVVDHTR